MNDLPQGFITIDEAIALMEKDTRTNPVVDTAFMVRNYNYTRPGYNFTIPLLKRDESGKIVRKGEVFIHFDDEEALWKFRGALKRHYRDLAGKEINETPVRHLSTTVDPDTNPSGRIMVNKNPMTKAGEELGSGDGELKVSE